MVLSRLLFCSILLELADDRTIREEHPCKADAHEGHAERIALGYLIHSPHHVLALLLHHIARLLDLLPAYLCVAVGLLNNATID
jgi:hypothetical protein